MSRQLLRRADSWLVLAIAAHVARRERPPLPISVHERATGPASARAPLAAELALRATGAGAARDGTLLTGTGGDQMLEPSRYERAPRAGALRPGDFARWGFRLAPQSVRRGVMARREPEPFALPWLRENARRKVHRGLHDDAAAEPRLAPQRTRWVWRLRAIQVALRSLTAVVEDEGAALVDPMLDRGFVAALAIGAGTGAYARRTDAMRTLASDLLPDEVCARSTKAVFQRPFWNRHADGFAQTFDGAGVNPALVDVDALKRHWSDPEGPSAQSMTVLQAAWLAGNAASAAGEDRGDRVGYSGR